MSDISSILDSLFPEGFSPQELRSMALDSHGVDIFGVYCLHTGRKIGTFDESELLYAIEEEGTDSTEDLVDALVVRTIASMRPSPALNKPDRLTIRELSSKRPNDCLAYLINRLYGNRQTLLIRDESSFSFLLERVRVYSVIRDRRSNRNRCHPASRKS